MDAAVICDGTNMEFNNSMYASYKDFKASSEANFEEFLDKVVGKLRVFYKNFNQECTLGAGAGTYKKFIQIASFGRSNRTGKNIKNKERGAKDKCDDPRIYGIIKKIIKDIGVTGTSYLKIDDISTIDGAVYKWLYVIVKPSSNWEREVMDEIKKTDYQKYQGFFLQKVKKTVPAGYITGKTEKDAYKINPDYNRTRGEQLKTLVKFLNCSSNSERICTGIIESIDVFIDDNKMYDSPSYKIFKGYNKGIVTELEKLNREFSGNGFIEKGQAAKAAAAQPAANQTSRTIIAAQPAANQSAAQAAANQAAAQASANQAAAQAAANALKAKENALKAQAQAESGKSTANTNAQAAKIAELVLEKIKKLPQLQRTTPTPTYNVNPKDKKKWHKSLLNQIKELKEMINFNEPDMKDLKEFFIEDEINEHADDVLISTDKSFIVLLNKIINSENNQKELEDTNPKIKNNFKEIIAIINEKINGIEKISQGSSTTTIHPSSPTEEDIKNIFKYVTIKSKIVSIIDFYNFVDKMQTRNLYGGNRRNNSKKGVKKTKSHMHKTQSKHRHSNRHSNRTSSQRR